MKNAIVGLYRDCSFGLFAFVIAFVILLNQENIVSALFGAGLAISSVLGWVAAIIASPLFIGIILFLIFLVLIGA